MPEQIVGDSVTGQTKGTGRVGMIDKDISTKADRIANDVMNTDRDATKPGTSDEDADIPDLSIP